MHWKDVAYALWYKIAAVDKIEANSQDPKKQCQDFFQDWLQTNNGGQAGPKTWETLLNAIKKLEELTRAREKIMTELGIGLNYIAYIWLGYVNQLFYIISILCI